MALLYDGVMRRRQGGFWCPKDMPSVRRGQGMVPLLWASTKTIKAAERKGAFKIVREYAQQPDWAAPRLVTEEAALLVAGQRLEDRRDD